MFTIYNDGVRSFSGTLERLYESRPVAPSEPTHPDAPRAASPEAPQREGGDSAGRGAGTPYVVSAQALAAYRGTLDLTSREPILHAHQVMRSPVVTVRGDADVRDAWAELRRHGIRQMPVQTAEIELVGLLSERALLEPLIIERDRIRYGQARQVSEVMDREVITAEPVTEVRRIARVMADRQMTAMPIVTEHDELVGIVSRGDLLRAMTRTPPLRLWT